MLKILSFKSHCVAASLAMMLVASCVYRAEAGALIAAGTDADDHGSVFGGVNQDGWFFMQRSLENIAPSVTNGSKKVVTLGSTGGDAFAAASSAFNLSTLPGLGWTLASVDTVAGINSFFGGVGAHTVGNTGIFMVDSSAVNVLGGIDALEDAALTSNAIGINNFLGAGGAAFTQSHSYGWLSTLVPGLTTTNFGFGGISGGLSLTPVGTAAFPGLTNADLSAGPFHNTFGGSLGLLSVFATSNSLTGNPPVILGISGGSVTNPNPIPEPSSFVVWSLIATATLVRRNRSRS